jgi:hypothetical protein
MLEDFGVPFLTKHIRALTVGFEYKFSDDEKP